MPSFHGQALAGGAFIFWGLCSFYRFLALERLCRFSLFDYVVLTKAMQGCTQLMFGVLAMYLEITFAGNSSAGVSVVLSDIQHRIHFLAYIAFCVSGAAQLFLVCSCLGAPTPARNSSASYLVAFRYASPFAFLTSAVIVVAPAYGTVAEAMAHKAIAVCLLAAALSEIVSIRWNYDTTVRSRSDSYFSARESTSAVYAFAFFNLLVGIYFVWTAFEYYLDYDSFAARTKAAAAENSEPILAMVAIALLVLAYTFAASVVSRCLAAPCGCSGADHAEALVSVEDVERAAAAAQVAIGHDENDSVSQAAPAPAPARGSKAAASSTVELSTIQSSVTAFDPWVDAHKKSASVVHVAATAAASAAAVPVVSHAHDEPFSLVAKKSRSKALSTSATTEVPPSVVRPDVVVPIESEPVVKPRKVKKSKPESLSAATVSAASLQTPSFAMVLAPPPSDKSTASVSPAAVSVASTASSDSVIDLWDMSAEELEALRRRQKQMADDDLI